MTGLLVWTSLSVIASVVVVRVATRGDVAASRARGRASKQSRERREKRELLLEDAGGDRAALQYAIELVARIGQHDRWLADYLDLEHLLDVYVASAAASARARRLTARIDRGQCERSRACLSEYLFHRRIGWRAETDARLQELDDSCAALIALLEHTAERALAGVRNSPHEAVIISEISAARAAAERPLASNLRGL
jgi:hypothetical protein